MGRAKNTLKDSEVSSTPIKFRYSVTYASNSLEDYGISVKAGVNVPYETSMSPEQMEGMNNYRTVRQLYYQQAISSSLGTASFWDPMWQSTAASGTNDATYYHFPRQYSGSVLIFAIPSSQFGEQISRQSFILSASDSSYYIVDDGNGNLVDRLNSSTKVGNLFYAQGVAVITNEDYILPSDYLSTQADEELTTQDEEDIII